MSDILQAKFSGGLRSRIRASRSDARQLTYSTTFENPVLQMFISGVEWVTGKITILRWVKRFEDRGTPQDHTFFRQALDVMGIPLQTPAEQLAQIPKTGPVVVVANHPHGMVDGMVIADLIGRTRPDFRVLTRSLLTELDPVAEKYMISVPFPHDADAQAKGLKMRAEAMAYLKDGGVIAIFPSGVVSSSDTFFGPAIEREWNVFTAKMIHRSGATVVPVKFSGQNSRWYNMANRISATLRQSLLLHEIANQKNTPQAPTIADAIAPEEAAKWKDDPRGFMVWLRELTMNLPENPIQKK